MRTNQPRATPSKTQGLGIPRFNPVEKLTEMIPVKVQPSLKQAIPRPQSTWIRNLIIVSVELDTHYLVVLHELIHQATEDQLDSALLEKYDQLLEEKKRLVARMVTRRGKRGM